MSIEITPSTCLPAQTMIQIIFSVLLVLISCYVGLLMTISLVLQCLSAVARLHGYREKVNEIIEACNRTVDFLQGRFGVGSARNDPWYKG